ncbi:cell surface composition regulator GlgS [Shimwellia pseudoproteus]|nr:cell surface composition regulator GlgS [Shimwellia pseudoproteus]
MNHDALYSLENFDFLARTFARMHNEGRTVNINAVTGNMDEKHRQWFCKRYALYCRRDARVTPVELEAEH